MDGVRGRFARLAARTGHSCGVRKMRRIACEDAQCFRELKPTTALEINEHDHGNQKQ